jgi:hypothetical protein
LLPVIRDPGSIPRGVLMWNRDSPVSVIWLQFKSFKICLVMLKTHDPSSGNTYSPSQSCDTIPLTPWTVKYLHSTPQNQRLIFERQKLKL